MRRPRKKNAPKRGATFDTGMLIALQNRNHNAIQALQALRSRRAPITIPTPVVAEFWRGQGRRLLEMGQLEELTPALAEAAGWLLKETGGSNAVDATVIASAAQRKDVVLTQDPDDLDELAAHAEGVDVIRV